MAALPDEIRRLAKGYTPLALVYMDGEGRWRKNPKTLRDRISNEFWHQAWAAIEDARFAGEIAEVMSVLRQASLIEKWLGEFSNNAGRDSDKRQSLMHVIESCYAFIGYLSFIVNCRQYFADWDYAGRRKRDFFVERSEEALGVLVNFLKDQDTRVREIAERLLSLDCRLFFEMYAVIAEEESLRYMMNESLRCSVGPSVIDGYYDQVCTRVNLDLLLFSKTRAALLRPCCEILGDSRIAMDSGLQFNASAILGAVRDTRSLDALVSAIEDIQLRYTNVRCNVIFALGRLKRKESLAALASVLCEPEMLSVKINDHQYEQSLENEKCEAIWALGKFGRDAAFVINEFAKYTKTANRDLGVALAWAAGKIGAGQREMLGGIDSRIMTILMNLLETHDLKIFEEIVCSMRDLGLPEFVYALYLRDTKTVPILALKPSSTGFYELSETIFHLLSVKKPVVIAVTGDSGTGKTYFCNTIKNGFGGIAQDEILYMMRDDPASRELFNRMLGIALLKRTTDPAYYMDYPWSGAEDDPDAFVSGFMQGVQSKKLIIIDGWLDEAFFLPVIEAFHRKGLLDILVNFRTTYSTRRLNLEEREELLENVRTCLSYIEGATLEETEFYYDDRLLIYCLDNSIDSRIDSGGIMEIFSRRKIEQWGDHIRVGVFARETRPLVLARDDQPLVGTKCAAHKARFALREIQGLSAEEGSFVRKLNDDVEGDRHLLQSIAFTDHDVRKIRFYTPGQLAFGSDDGYVGILSGINDHVFSYPAHKAKVLGYCVGGGDIYSFDEQGDLAVTSFKSSMVRRIDWALAPISAIAGCRYGKIITGHQDGTVTSCDTRSKETDSVRVGSRAVVEVCMLGADRIGFRCGDDGIEIWDRSKGTITMLSCAAGKITAMCPYPAESIAVCVTRAHGAGSEILIVSTTNGKRTIVKIPGDGDASAIYAYPDGRIFVGLKTHSATGSRGNLFMLDPREEFSCWQTIGAHGSEITDCLTMGPRIITCGREHAENHTLRIWGTESYVKTEHGKLKYLTGNVSKPPYYRMLF